MLYYLNDSAARPQGDLPWSSRHFSAFALGKELVDLENDTLMYARGLGTQLFSAASPNQVFYMRYKGVIKINAYYYTYI